MTKPNAMPMVERVREHALASTTDPDLEVDFYWAAIELGCTTAQAEDFAQELTIRAMRARGAI